MCNFDVTWCDKNKHLVSHKSTGPTCDEWNRGGLCKRKKRTFYVAECSVCRDRRREKEDAEYSQHRRRSHGHRPKTKPATGDGSPKVASTRNLKPNGHHSEANSAEGDVFTDGTPPQDSSSQHNLSGSTPGQSSEARHNSPPQTQTSASPPKRPSEHKVLRYFAGVAPSAKLQMKDGSSRRRSLNHGATPKPSPANGHSINQSGSDAIPATGGEPAAGFTVPHAPTDPTNAKQPPQERKDDRSRADTEALPNGHQGTTSNSRQRDGEFDLSIFTKRELEKFNALELAGKKAYYARVFEDIRKSSDLVDDYEPSDDGCEHNDDTNHNLEDG